MRNKVRLAAGAAVLLLAMAPATAQRSGLAASPGRAGAHNRTGTAGRGFFVGRNRCMAQTRRCFGNRFGLATGWYTYGYGGLVEDPESLRDQGFFADTGDAWQENGRAVYDYDRGYPYDWYRDPGAAAAQAAPHRSGPPMVRCEVDWVAGARGAHSAVRICRGHR
ncbi:MAG TPA: hypothetical protein VH331_09155 [Allosphingosinicella sp.]|jgi:hypothetical protein|nr:hypothetical protein [Allosphingosinicella sp.]